MEIIFPYGQILGRVINKLECSGRIRLRVDLNYQNFFFPGFPLSGDVPGSDSVTLIG